MPSDMSSYRRLHRSPFSSHFLIDKIRRPWIWFPLLLGISVVLHLQISHYAHTHKSSQECHREPIRTPIDNFQNLNQQPMVDEEFIRQARLVRSENAIVTSMYNDAFAVPIVTLGHSLNRVNSTARRILFYIPGQVSDRALCVASASGFEPYAVERIEPPKDGGVHDHFKDQYTKLAIWRFSELGLKAVVYLDADTVVLRNFDELFLLPFNFAAVPDVYIDDPGFTVAFNAGVLFVRPSSAAYNNLVRHIETAKYPHFEAEQAYLNVFYGPDAVRLPYAYNGNMAIKKRNPELWAGIKHELRLVHFTLVKPFWRNTYTDMGLDDMHRNAQMRAEEWGALWKDEILEWDHMWKETEDLYRLEFDRCGTKQRDIKVSAFP